MWCGGLGIVRRLQCKTITASKATQRRSQSEFGSALKNWQGTKETKSESIYHLVEDVQSTARTSNRTFLMKRSKANMAKTSQGPWVFGKNPLVEEWYAKVETRVQTSPTYQVCLC